MNKYGHNEENSHCEVKNKSVSPKSSDIKSGTYFSFDIDTSSSENEELEIRSDQSKDRTTVDWDSKDIGKSEIISSNSWKGIRVGNYFINDYRSTSQHNIENIASSEAQASTNTTTQHDNGFDFTTSTGTPRSLSKTTHHSRQFTPSITVQTTKYKAILNEHDTNPTNGTVNQQTISKPTQPNNTSFRRLDRLLISVKLMMHMYIQLRLMLVMTNNVEF